MCAKILIGTSGWVYGDWEGIFYPTDLASKDKLRFYSREFETGEINYSFYHLPRLTTYENWYSQTPDDFIFAVKASRFITHVKRIKNVRQAWKKFFDNAIHLDEKLGPILFQFPPSFRIDLKRLESFLGILKSGYRYAFEFRHKSWFDENVYDLLRKYNFAWVIADSPKYPKSEIITSDFAYIRMHGSSQLFTSKYTKAELNKLAEKIQVWSKKLSAIYTYFNNDFQGHAIQNASELKKILKSQKLI